MENKDVICIPITRYDELIRAEVEREILFHAYQTTVFCDMDRIMDAIFNPKFKYRAGAGMVRSKSEVSSKDEIGCPK